MSAESSPASPGQPGADTDADSGAGRQPAAEGSLPADGRLPAAGTVPVDGAVPVNAPAAPEGSRLETVRLLFQLAGDLASVPFHLVIFLVLRKRHRRRFLEALGRIPERTPGGAS